MRGTCPHVQQTLLAWRHQLLYSPPDIICPAGIGTANKNDNTRVLFLEPWGGEKKHSCVVVLVGCANPCGADDIRRRVEKLMPPGKESLLDVRACPPHLSPELGVDFESVARWVQARIEFVQAAGRVQPGEGVQCGVFGFSGILSVLEKQFGSASRDLTAEMILAKQYSDEEDGLLPGGFAPVLIE